MAQYLFKADGVNIALPITPQGEAWGWLQLDLSGDPSPFLWLINLYTASPSLQLSGENDFPRVARGLRPIASTIDGSVLVQELDDSLAFTGRIYLVSRLGIKRFTENVAIGTGEMNIGWFDSTGRLWAEVAAGDGRAKRLSSFEYVGNTRLDEWSSSFGAGEVALLFKAGLIPGRVYACQRSASEVQRLGYFDADSMAWTNLVTFGGAGGGRALVGNDGFLYIAKAEAGEKNILQKYDQDGMLITELELTDADPNDTVLTSMVMDAVGRLWIQGTGSGTANAWCVNAGAMSVEIFGEVEDSLMMPGQDFDGRSAVALIDTPSVGRDTIGVFQFATRIDPDQVDLGLDVVKPLALRAGLQESEINVDDLIGQAVIGYVIPSRSQVREMIEPLMGVYFFDAVESDDQVKFVLRGSNSIVSIPERYIGAEQDKASDDSEALSLERKQEMELPSTINLAYMSSVSNYEAAQQPSRRLVSESRESMSISVPIVLTDDQARQAADSMMFSAWTERQSTSFSTGRRYARYEPTDVLTVQRGAITKLVRLTEKNYGANGIIQWRAVVEEPSIYTQFSTGVPSPRPDGEVTPPAPTVALLLDIPMLRDVDNDPGFYFAAYGVNPAAWQGATLFQSADGGGSYLQLANGILIDPSTAGAALTALPVQSDLFAFAETGEPDSIEYNELFDEASTVDVLLESGSLSSATRAQVLEGANVAVLGNEIIQFKNATLIADGHYRLSGLLRGRLGTEQFMLTHEVGERFVLLEGTSIRSIAQTFISLNAERLHKAVSSNATLQQTTAFPFTNTGVRRKPLSPWRFAGGRDEDDNLLLQWKPRTRFPVSWGVGVVNPSGESEERYAVYIPSFAAAIRVIITSEPEAVYTAAQQTEDYGSPQPVIEAEVCQVSPEYGLGYFTSGVF